MKREDLIQSIYALHGQAKKTEFGEHLISHVQLQGHLAEQPDYALEAIRRFYEGLLETDN